MFNFYKECSQEFFNTSSWLGLFLQFSSVSVAAIALYIAWIRLAGLTRSQALQAQMNLISLENEMRKNGIQYKYVLNEIRKITKVTQHDFSEANKNLMDQLNEKRINTFELYITSADKIAALLNSKYLTEHFPERNWKDEYNEIFQSVMIQYEGEETFIPGKANMIKNTTIILKHWNPQR